MDKKKYYIVNDGIQKGPLSYSELELLNLNNDTPIWYEGMSDWNELGKIEELNSLKKISPPNFKPINKSETISFQSIYIRNKIYFLILLFILSIYLFFTIFNFFQNNKNEFKSKNIDSIEKEDIVIKNEKKIEVNSVKEMTPYELRKELLKKENSNPLNYLKVEQNLTANRVQTQHATMFRHSKWEVDGYNLTGVIINNSTLAIFKDIKLEIIFYSKTKSKISSIDFVVYEIVNPQSKVEFNNKVYPPEGTSNYEVNVKNASSQN